MVKEMYDVHAKKEQVSPPAVIWKIVTLCLNTYIYIYIQHAEALIGIALPYEECVSELSFVTASIHAQVYMQKDWNAHILPQYLFPTSQTAYKYKYIYNISVKQVYTIHSCKLKY